MEGWQRNEPLAAHTTFKVGGPAEFFAVVGTEEELAARIREARTYDLPITVLGEGSNVLVADDGIPGAVIVNAIDGMTETAEGDQVLLTAGAGEALDDVVAYAVAHGYWGIENLSHIPGSIGATPVQNVGAYGVEIGEHILSVRVYDIASDTFRELSPQDCAFGYRDSIFKHAAGAHYVVTGVTLRLSRTPVPRLGYRDLAVRFADAHPTLADIRSAVVEIRSKKFPDWHAVGTAGSFFKNPIVPVSQYEALAKKYPDLPAFPVGDTHAKIALGWILDKVINVRGLRVGNVGTYDQQALVMVNYGASTAREIEAFAHDIASRVRESVGIEIEWEVTRLPR